MRLLLAILVGAALGLGAAVVLGDYPLSGSVPWAAAVVVPFLIGAAMVLVTDRHTLGLWALSGPFGAASLAWGFRIASGYGIDTVPTPCVVAVGIGLLWPVGTAALTRRQRGSPAPPLGFPDSLSVSASDRQLGD